MVASHSNHKGIIKTILKQVISLNRDLSNPEYSTSIQIIMRCLVRIIYNDLQKDGSSCVEQCQELYLVLIRAEQLMQLLTEQGIVEQGEIQWLCKVTWNAGIRLVNDKQSPNHLVISFFALLCKLLDYVTDSSLTELQISSQFLLLFTAVGESRQASLALQDYQETAHQLMNELDKVQDNPSLYIQIVFVLFEYALRTRDSQVKQLLTKVVGIHVDGYTKCTAISSL